MRVAQAIVWALMVMGQRTGTAQTNDTGVRKELKATYAKLAAAMKQKNLSALLKFYTSDYTRQESNGHKMNRLQFKAAMQNVIRSQQTVRGVNFRMDSLRVTGKTAVVTTTAVLKAHVMFMDTYEQPVPRKTYEMVATWPIRDFWVKTSAGWRIQRSKMLAPTKATLEKQ